MSSERLIVGSADDAILVKNGVNTPDALKMEDELASLFSNGVNTTDASEMEDELASFSDGVGTPNCANLKQIFQQRIALIAQSLNRSKNSIEMDKDKIDLILKELDIDAENLAYAEKTIRGILKDFLVFSVRINNNTLNTLLFEIFSVFSLDPADYSNRARYNIKNLIKDLLNIYQNTILNDQERSLQDARYLIQSGIENNAREKKKNDNLDKKNTDEQDPHFLIELFEGIESSLRSLDLKHIWGLDLLNQFHSVVDGDGKRKMNLKEFRTGEIDLRNEEQRFFRNSTENQIEGFQKCTIEHLAKISDRILEELLKNNKREFTPEETAILKSKDLNALIQLIKANDISTPKKLQLKNFAIIRVNLMHIAFIIASKYSKEFSRKATDEIVSRFNNSIRFDYVKGTSLVEERDQNGIVIDRYFVDSHFSIKGYPGFKVFFAEPKDEASIGRKVLIKRIDTNEFSGKIKDQARMTITVPDNFFVGNNDEIRARLINFISVLIPRIGTDFDFSRTRENINVGVRAFNDRSNPDRISFQFVCYVKFIKPNKSHNKKSLTTESLARRTCIIPLEVQITPESQFVVDKSSSLYEKYNEERQGYEERNRNQALDNSGLLIDPAEYFKKLFAKAVDLTCYTDTRDPNVVEPMINTNIAYRELYSKIDDIPLIDPNGPTFDTILELLCTRGYQTYLNCMNMLEREYLCTILQALLDNNPNQTAREKLSLVINRLNTGKDIPVNA